MADPQIQHIRHEAQLFVWVVLEVQVVLILVVQDVLHLLLLLCAKLVLLLRDAHVLVVLRVAQVAQGVGASERCLQTLKSQACTKLTLLCIELSCRLALGLLLVELVHALCVGIVQASGHNVAFLTG